MGDPFRVILDFNEPVRPKRGNVLMVEIHLEGLPPELHVVEELAMALSHTLASHMKSLVDGTPEQTKAAFLGFMADAWDNSPEAIDLTTLVGSKMAEA